MHPSIFCLLGFFLPFFAIYGGYGVFKSLRRVTPDISIPTIAAFNMVLVNTVFPWLVVDDFVGPSESTLLFHSMLIGTLVVVAIIVARPREFAKVDVCATGNPE